jgi:hypothetical protein
VVVTTVVGLHVPVVIVAVFTTLLVVVADTTALKSTATLSPGARCT